MYKAPEYVDSTIVEELVLDKTKVPGKDYLIVDVRDVDRANGHIPGSINVPAAELSDRLPELLKTHAEVPKLYFHCALSQVRGPKSARIWAEGLAEQQQRAASCEGNAEKGAQAVAAAAVAEAAEAEAAAASASASKYNQEVFILRGGFVQWQRKHRDTNPSLLENYNREYWEAEEEY